MEIQLNVGASRRKSSNGVIDAAAQLKVFAVPNAQSASKLPWSTILHRQTADAETQRASTTLENGFELLRQLSLLEFLERNKSSKPISDS